MSPDLKEILIATIPSIIPSFLVGFGIMINKNDTNRLSGEIAGLRSELKGDIAGLRTELKGDIAGVRAELHNSVVRLDTRIDALSKQLSDAIVTLVNIGNDLDKRVTRLEDKG